MRYDNRIKDAIRKGSRAYGVRLTFPSPEIVEILEAADLDFMFLDCEHGVFDPPSIENICRAADLIGVTPIARAPDISESTIGQLLDRGIRGIIGPHISCENDALQLVKACLFGPEGQRSFGGGRGTNYQVGISDMPAYLAACNESILIGAMFESFDAIKNLDKILAVDRIDYFMFGPADFAQDLGYPGQPRHPEVLKVVENTTARIHAADRLMREDIMVVANIKDIILEGGKTFVSKRKS